MSILALLTILAAQSTRADLLPASSTTSPPSSNSSVQFALVQNYLPHNFTDGFAFRTAADYPGSGDPTHGFVNYVDLATATAGGLVRVVKGRPGSGAPFNVNHHRHEQLYLGVDHQTVISNVTATNATSLLSSAQGRGSLRLESLRTFDRGLLVADFAHMPANQCGVWPAFWTYNFKEDPVGEFDILEGVNHQVANMVSLHTGQACRFGAGWETGVERRTECTVVSGNKSTYGGCGITSTSAASYGTAFNSAGGGVYAALLEPDRLRVWHWPRADVPSDVQHSQPDPSVWGRPLADFAQTSGGCNVQANLHSLTMILNTDFCGDNQSDGMWNNDAACARFPSCRAFVASQPGAFNETYWLHPQHSEQHEYKQCQHVNRDNKLNIDTVLTTPDIAISDSHGPISDSPNYYVEAVCTPYCTVSYHQLDIDTYVVDAGLDNTVLDIPHNDLYDNDNQDSSDGRPSTAFKTSGRAMAFLATILAAARPSTRAPAWTYTESMESLESLAERLARSMAWFMEPVAQAVVAAPQV